MVQKIPKTFGSWLMQQVSRSDVVGEFARFVKNDSGWPVHKSIYEQDRYMLQTYRENSACGMIFKGSGKAEMEWDKIASRQFFEKVTRGQLLSYSCEECRKEVVLPMVLTARINDWVTYSDVCFDCFMCMELWDHDKSRAYDWLTLSNLTSESTLWWLKDKGYIKLRSKYAKVVSKEN